MISYKDKKIVVATSAGMDSMVLLDLLRLQGATVYPCYINHLQRPQEITGEIACLQRYCAQHNLPFMVKEIAVENMKQHDNKQAFFRQERYRLLTEYAMALQAPFIATAHHLDDQVETQLMRLVKNYEVLSLTGITPILEIETTTIIRPLLQLRKCELAKYCQRQGLSYCEDSSNQQNEYFRNNIRNIVLPILEQENKQFVPEFNSQINDFLALYQLKYQELEQLFLDFKSDHEPKIAIDKLKILLQDKLVVEQKMLITILCQSLMQHHIVIKQKQITAILALIYTDDSVQDKIEIMHNIFIGKQYGYLYFWQKQEQAITIRLDGSACTNEQVSVTYHETMSSVPRGAQYFVCDTQLLQQPIILTNDIRHSYIKFNGGTKKMNRLYIDAKLLPYERNNALIIKNNDTNEVLYDLATGRINHNYHYQMLPEMMKIIISIDIL